MSEIIDSDSILNKIYLIRGMKVMLDKDLAELYGVKTKVLNQAVRRNENRFPQDFMFQLNYEEFENLKSQFVTSSWGGVRKHPHAFTEHGIMMLSSVLNSDRAINVNIQIMRTFIKLRRMLSKHEELRKKIDEMEKRYDTQFKAVFDAIKQLIAEEKQPKKKIGFSPK